MTSMPDIKAEDEVNRKAGGKGLGWSAAEMLALARAVVTTRATATASGGMTAPRFRREVRAAFLRDELRPAGACGEGRTGGPLDVRRWDGRSVAACFKRWLKLRTSCAAFRDAVRAVHSANLEPTPCERDIERCATYVYNGGSATPSLLADVVRTPKYPIGKPFPYIEVFRFLSAHPNMLDVRLSAETDCDGEGDGEGDSPSKPIIVPPPPPPPPTVAATVTGASAPNVSVAMPNSALTQQQSTTAVTPAVPAQTPSVVPPSGALPVTSATIGIPAQPSTATTTTAATIAPAPMVATSMPLATAGFPTPAAAAAAAAATAAAAAAAVSNDMTPTTVPTVAAGVPTPDEPSSSVPAVVDALGVDDSVALNGTSLSLGLNLNLSEKQRLLAAAAAVTDGHSHGHVCSADIDMRDRRLQWEMAKELFADESDAPEEEKKEVRQLLRRAVLKRLRELDETTGDDDEQTSSEATKRPRIEVEEGRTE